MQQDRLGSRLAALATAIDDASTASFGDLSASAAAALMVIRRQEPIAIQDIAAHVGLTHSATVRLVDRLEKDWLVRRLRRRGREVQVEATARGKRRARELHGKRLASVEALLDGLAPDQQEALGGLVDRLLEHLVESGGDPARICRFCGDDTCGSDCPVRNAETPPPDAT